jgi:hypothetical protein
MREGPSIAVTIIEQLNAGKIIIKLINSMQAVVDPI